jgi:hypothetical protein
MRHFLGTFTAFAFLIVLSGTPAQADTVYYEFDGTIANPFELPGDPNTNNDCSGYFGSGFENCRIAFGETDISPVIIKFDMDDEEDTEINSELFPSVTGDEWEASDTTDNFSEGTWTYTLGDDDPDVRFWAAKSGPGFVLFWDVDADDKTSLCDGTENSLACLMAANPVTTGTWATLDGKGLSHLTFYDSAPSPVPVPAAFWLFGTALIGFIGVSRRTKV